MLQVYLDPCTVNSRKVLARFSQTRDGFAPEAAR